MEESEWQSDWLRKSIAPPMAAGRSESVPRNESELPTFVYDGSIRDSPFPQLVDFVMHIVI